MSNALTFKRGTTFNVVGTYTVGDVAQSLSGVTVACRIKTTADVVVDNLVVTLLPQSGATLGQYTLSRAHGLTATWPVGRQQADIIYTFPVSSIDPGGDRIATETFIINVVDFITP